MVLNPMNRLLTLFDLHTILSFGGQAGLQPNDLATYQCAFVHTSYCKQSNQQALQAKKQSHLLDTCVPLQEESNLRLAWLGDSVLQLIVTDYLLKRHQGTEGLQQEVGPLTNRRSQIVSNRSLGRLALQLGFGELLLISQGLESNPAAGRKNLDRLADCFEAFVGAVYTDLGYTACKDWFEALMDTTLVPPNASSITCNTLNTNFSNEHRLDCMEMEIT